VLSEIAALFLRIPLEYCRGNHFERQHGRSLSPPSTAGMSASDMLSKESDPRDASRLIRCDPKQQLKENV
jgi:hypothetical protein